jgi:hypothetical protein
MIVTGRIRGSVSLLLPKADLFNVLCGAANLGKKLVLCGQNEIQYAE